MNNQFEISIMSPYHSGQSRTYETLDINVLILYIYICISLAVYRSLILSKSVSKFDPHRGPTNMTDFVSR